MTDKDEAPAFGNDGPDTGKGDLSAAPEREVPFGHVGWACSDEDGGPDVGIFLGLGNGAMLWCGDITSNLYDDERPDIEQLGDESGWWIILYTKDSARVLGKTHDRYLAQDIFDEIAALLRSAPTPHPRSRRFLK